MNTRVVFGSFLFALAIVTIFGTRAGQSLSLVPKTAETGIDATILDPLTPPTAVRLGINRFNSITLDNNRADAILADGMKLLKDKDGADDVSCTIELTRDGDVGTFTAAKGIITTKADFAAVCATAGRVHVVKEIHWCGAPGTNIGGCADEPGTCMVVTRPAIGLEGILWMHEYGHNQGLPHRINKFAVMTDVALANDQRRVNAAECGKYQVTSLVPARGRPQRMVTQRSSMDVREFVRQFFIHGVPYEQASTFPRKAVPELLRMLADPREEKAWANIVVTLGAIGDPRAAQPLIEFLTADSGTISDARYRAKVAVLMSLGYLINRSGDRRALEFLKSSLSTSVWTSRVKWVGPFGENESDLSLHLTKLAIWGLALSGNPSAGKTLLAFKASESAFASAEPSLIEVLKEAVEMHSRVVRLGLLETYRRMRR